MTRISREEQILKEIYEFFEVPPDQKKNVLVDKITELKFTHRLANEKLNKNKQVPIGKNIVSISQPKIVKKFQKLAPPKDPLSKTKVIKTKVKANDNQVQKSDNKMELLLNQHINGLHSDQIKKNRFKQPDIPPTYMKKYHNYDQYKINNHHHLVSNTNFNGNTSNRAIDQRAQEAQLTDSLCNQEHTYQVCNQDTSNKETSNESNKVSSDKKPTKLTNKCYDFIFEKIKKRNEVFLLKKMIEWWSKKFLRKLVVKSNDLRSAKVDKGKGRNDLLERSKMNAAKLKPSKESNDLVRLRDTDKSKIELKSHSENGTSKKINLQKIAETLDLIATAKTKSSKNRLFGANNSENRFVHRNIGERDLERYLHPNASDNNNGDETDDFVLNFSSTSEIDSHSNYRGIENAIRSIPNDIVDFSDSSVHRKMNSDEEDILTNITTRWRAACKSRIMSRNAIDVNLSSALEKKKKNDIFNDLNKEKIGDQEGKDSGGVKKKANNEESTISQRKAVDKEDKKFNGVDQNQTDQREVTKLENDNTVSLDKQSKVNEKELEGKVKEDSDEKSRKEEARKVKEGVNKKAKKNEVRKVKEIVNKKTKKDETKKAKEEAERKAKEEAERKVKEEEEKKANEEAVRKSNEESERKAKEEAERKVKEEEEKKANEEAIRKSNEELERKAKEEAERKSKEELDKKANEEVIRKSNEELERKAKEEAEIKAKEEIERETVKEEERNIEQTVEKSKDAQVEGETDSIFSTDFDIVSEKGDIASTSREFANVPTDTNTTSVDDVKEGSNCLNEDINTDKSSEQQIQVEEGGSNLERGSSICIEVMDNGLEIHPESDDFISMSNLEDVVEKHEIVNEYSKAVTDHNSLQFASDDFEYKNSKSFLESTQEFELPKGFTLKNLLISNATKSEKGNIQPLPEGVSLTDQYKYLVQIITEEMWEKLIEGERESGIKPYIEPPVGVTKPWRFTPEYCSLFLDVLNEISESTKLSELTRNDFIALCYTYFDDLPKCKNPFLDAYFESCSIFDVELLNTMYYVADSILLDCRRSVV